MKNDGSICVHVNLHGQVKSNMLYVTFPLFFTVFALALLSMRLSVEFNCSRVSVYG